MQEKQEDHYIAGTVKQTPEGSEDVIREKLCISICIKIKQCVR